MKKQILSTILVLCLCVSSALNAYALQEEFPQQENFLIDEYTNEPVLYEDVNIPTYEEAYERMIALKENSNYKEGTSWNDNYNPVTGNDPYTWKGGLIEGKIIQHRGCAAFAALLSDEAFGSLPSRKLNMGNFTFSDIKVGDIIRLFPSHSVIVLQVTDAGVIIAEGNNSGKVHWERAIPKTDVENALYLLTRYPKGYIPPTDPDANEPIEGGQGTFGKLNWILTKNGTLTISGSGVMPENADFPWEQFKDKTLKIVIEKGVTNIGSNAFYQSNAISVTIPDGVTTIGSNAFRESSIVAVTIPSSVTTIGDSAFRECKNLVSVNISEGVKTIVQNAFRACRELTFINLPASIESVGAAVFMECDNIESVRFAPRNDTKTVTMGDNIFTRCYRLTTVTLPIKINKIGEGMFLNCGYLNSVKIPQGAESIEMQAFASCSGLTEVIIPASVTQIGISAFSACPMLKNIYFSDTQAKWNSVRKIGDTASTLSKVNVIYNSTGPTTTSESTTESTTTSAESTSEETTASILSAVKANLYESNNIVFAAAVNSLEYKEVGFIFEVDDKKIIKSINSVYSSIEESNYTAEELGKKYMYAFTITDISNLGKSIKVTPYVTTVDNKEIYGESTEYSIESLNKAAQDTNTNFENNSIDMLFEEKRYNNIIKETNDISNSLHLDEVTTGNSIIIEIDALNSERSDQCEKAI